MKVELKNRNLTDLGLVADTKAWMSATHVDVSLNQLHSLQPLAELHNLKSIVATANNLQRLPPTWLKNLSQLTTLSLARNVLDVGQQPLPSLPMLNTLLLQANQNLTAVGVDAMKINRLRALTELDLSDTNLDTAEPLRGMISLTHLTLDRNHLGAARSSLSALDSLRNLVELSLGWNRLSGKALGALQGCASTLALVRLNNNSIDTLQHLPNLPNLVELDLAYNRLSHWALLDSSDDSICPLLEILNISYNSFNLASSEHILASLPSLAEVYIAGNSGSISAQLTGRGIIVHGEDQETGQPHTGSNDHHSNSGVRGQSNTDMAFAGLQLEQMRNKLTRRIQAAKEAVRNQARPPSEKPVAKAPALGGKRSPTARGSIARARNIANVAKGQPDSPCVVTEHKNIPESAPFDTSMPAPVPEPTSIAETPRSSEAVDLSESAPPSTPTATPKPGAISDPACLPEAASQSQPLPFTESLLTCDNDAAPMMKLRTHIQRVKKEGNASPRPASVTGYRGRLAAAMALDSEASIALERTKVDIKVPPPREMARTSCRNFVLPQKAGSTGRAKSRATRSAFPAALVCRSNLGS